MHRGRWRRIIDQICQIRKLMVREWTVVSSMVTRWMILGKAMPNRWERNVRSGNEKPVRLTERDNSYGENCRIHNAMIRLCYYYCCYYGYQSPDEDIDCLNWTTKMNHWDQVRTITVTYHQNQNPVLAMINSPIH